MSDLTHDADPRDTQQPPAFQPTGPNTRFPAPTDPQGPVGRPIALLVGHPAALRGLPAQAAPA
jgi:hypothetical protein